MMGTTSSITTQSLGKIVQRAPAVGAKMWCLFFFVTLQSGAPCVRGVRSSNTHCVAIYRPISTWFASFIFGNDCVFKNATQFSHLSLDGATILAKLRSKIAKSPKIRGKACAHHFVQIAEGFEKKSTAVVYGLDHRCAPIEIFFRTSLPSADSKCQIS